jgi:hypothetical protein
VTTNTPTVENRIAATVAQRADGRWAWEVRVDGELLTWWVLTPDTPAYQAAAYGHSRWESRAHAKARHYARKAADRLHRAAQPASPPRRGTSGGGPC